MSGPEVVVVALDQEQLANLVIDRSITPRIWRDMGQVGARPLLKRIGIPELLRRKKLDRNTSDALEALLMVRIVGAPAETIIRDRL